jgi:hypothetical protein
MAAKYILLAVAIVLLAWAFSAALRNGGRLTRGGHVHVRVGVIFLIVAAILFWMQGAVV